MYRHEIDIRVRYAETDQMGFVYYGNYAIYFEVARVEVFRSLGFPYKNLEETGIGMPVLSLNIKYHRPAKYDDLLRVKTAIPHKPKARIIFHHEITSKNGTKLNTAETELAFINIKTGRPVRMPENLIGLLSPYYGE